MHRYGHLFSAFKGSETRGDAYGRFCVSLTAKTGVRVPRERHVKSFPAHFKSLHRETQERLFFSVRGDTTWPTARNHARARPCRDWGNCLRTGETVDSILTAPHHFHLGIELVLIRHVATVAAIAALLGLVSLAQAQSDNEREEMLRGGATKKGIYNIFGFDGTGLGRTTVRYDSKYAPGTIVINTTERRLYLVQGGGSALRYGIGVGRAGFQWKGTHKITAKKEFPDWTAPPEMIARQRDVPRHMKGGDPDNPLGTRAMYLGSTLYRIHGSNDPDSVGEAESSGCFRMRNEDIADLYNRVPVGTTVVVQ